MNTQAPGGRWAVVQHFYDRVHSSLPGSAESEIAEHAVTLAVSSDRDLSNPSFACYDLKRNARYSLHRSARRLQANLSTIIRESSCGVERPVRETPESLCIAADLEARIRTAVARRDPRLIDTFDRLIAGDSVVEVSRLTGRPTRSIDRDRQAVRQIAARVMSCEG